MYCVYIGKVFDLMFGGVPVVDDGGRIIRMTLRFVECPDGDHGELDHHNHNLVMAEPWWNEHRTLWSYACGV